MLDKLSRLGELRERGIIDEDEFRREKARILAEGSNDRNRHAAESDGRPARATGPAPESQMVWAVLSTLFCFLPFGIVALVKASQVESLWYAGNQERAQLAADSARSWCIASAVTAGVLVLLVLLVSAGQSWS
jgi:hypothetical protein